MIFFSILCYILSALQITNAECAPGDEKNTQENCVHVERLDATWREAENFCQAHNGHLASVHNVFDMTSLRKVAGTCTKFWLGGQCESGQKCKWVDGTDFDYTNFLNGNTGTENCVLADTRSGTWSTQPCDVTSCIACEIKGSMKDCQDWMKAGYTDSGKYTILVNGKETEVWCDMQVYGGGWILFQNRVDDTEVYWNRTWNEYKNGFGDTDETANFWLGNDAIHELTSGQNATLRVEMYGDRTPGSKNATDFWFAHYFHFSVSLFS
uniref:C-type lectin domain-containing protein n=1 Tax=Caenorhabditis japonica TaxID=281687 RepID=A0A8R1DGF9_CAEJA